MKDIIVNPTPAPPKRRKRRNDLGQTKKQAKKGEADQEEHLCLYNLEWKTYKC